MFFSHEFELFLLFIIKAICSSYLFIRDKANHSDDVKFFSSILTIIGFSLVYAFNFFIATIKKLKKQVRFFSEEMGPDLLDERKKKYIAQVVKLRKSLTKKEKELVGKGTEEKDWHLLLDQIKDIKKQIHDIQDKLSTLDGLT